MSSALRFRGLAYASFFALVPTVTAQAPETTTTKRPMSCGKCTTAPVLDGVLDDDAWKTAGKAEMFVERVTGNVATDQTFAYLTYDDKCLYVAFDCRDSEPDKVEARETIRDSKYANQQNGDSPNKEDNVTFTIDPFFTKKPGDLSVFSVNALGTPSAQIAGGRGGKLEWKGNWDSVAKRTPTGWAVEMRIPWQMLNYPNASKAVTMGVNFFRYQYRTRIETLWSNVGVHGFTELEGVWSGVDVPKGLFKPKLSLLPYVLAGVTDDHVSVREGLDMRYTATPELTAVGSLFPDFNTIEGAVESIAFSRAERFVPEKRPFFLEGQDYFFPGTRFNDIGAYFYSRRIPTFDFGAKVYGKVTPTDSVGVLNTLEFGGRRDTVLRYKHDLTSTSDVGVFVGQQADSDTNGTVLMVDQHARFGPVGLESQFAKTWGKDAGGGAVVLSANYQKGNNVSLIQWHTISNDFKIPNGFIPYFGYHGLYGFTDFSSRWKSGAWRSYDYGVYGLAWDHLDGSRYQRSVGAFGTLVHKDDWRFSVSQDHAVVDGTTDSTVQLTAVYGNSNRFRKIGLGVMTGRLADEPATFLTPSASFRLFRHLDLSYAGAVLNFQGSTRQHIVTAGYDFSPTRSVGGRLVALDADTNWYAFYRSSGGQGHGLLSDRRRPQRPPLHPPDPA